MKLLGLSYKNAIRSWWRSLTLGLFIFFVCFIMIFFNMFNLTIRNNMEDAIINSTTGHIQIRSALSEEGDMADLMKEEWEDVYYLETDLLKKITANLNSKFPELKFTPRVRQNVLYISDTEKQPTMIIGIDPALTVYQDALELIEGRFLDPQNTHEVLINQRQADALAVKVGQTLGAIARTKDGYSVDAALTVVGIFKCKMLSIFGFRTSYTDLRSARELSDFTAGEATDIIVYVPDKKETNKIVTNMDFEFNKAGINTILQNQDTESAAEVKLSTYTNMGGFFMGVIDGMAYSLIILIILLFIIVTILIVNLIYMMGIERYKEIGTLRAIGFSKWRVIRIFISEILIICAFFGFLGIFAGCVLILIFHNVGMPSPTPSLDYVMGKRLFFVFQIEQIILVAAILFIFTILASFLPAYKACSLKPMEALKEE